MKQRFLNQKLGKRNSRRAQLEKSKSLLNQSRGSTIPRNPPVGAGLRGQK
jgi:hypothetical protein